MGGSAWGGKAIQSAGVTLGALARGKGQRKAEKSREQGSYQSDEILRGSAGESAEYLQPYAAIGTPALQGLTAIANTPQQQFAYRNPGEFLSSYFSGPEFSALNTQAQDNILRNQAATGGFRSGATQAGLGMIAPTIGIQALQRQNAMDENAYQLNQAGNQQRYAQLMGLTGIGYDAAGGLAGIRSALGTNLANGAMFRGGSKSASLINQYDAQGQAHEDLGAIWGS